MGRVKKSRTYKAPSNGRIEKSKLSSKTVSKHPHPKPSRQAAKQSNLKPIIPFSPTDRILLVGEGDFSFSASLLTSHECTTLLSTSFDDRSTLLSKYPQAASHIAAIEAEDSSKILFGVDATKLAKAGVGAASGAKHVKKAVGKIDRIVFNFPHTGGLTKDVHRQIRANQELIRDFLKAAVPLLVTQSGAILITLFEGDPYRQWELKGLARQVGLRVERSFQFVSAAYPGYAHTRTLGDVDRRGGWKGEDRPARTYILKPIQDTESQSQGTPRAKRKLEDTDSESD